MDIFDMVKAAPPPQTINPVESKMSTPSPIPPDSPLDAMDLLESGIISNEDDLDKEANLDESPFQIPKRKPDDTCQNMDESPFKIPKRLKKFEEDIEELDKAMGNTNNRIEEQPEEDNTPSKKLKKSEESPKTTAKPAKTKKSAVADKTADTYPFKHHKKRPTEPVEDEGDEEKSEEDHLLTAMPTKTKVPPTPRYTAEEPVPEEKDEEEEWAPSPPRWLPEVPLTPRCEPEWHREDPASEGEVPRATPPWRPAWPPTPRYHQPEPKTPETPPLATEGSTTVRTDVPAAHVSHSTRAFIAEGVRWRQQSVVWTWPEGLATEAAGDKPQIWEEEAPQMNPREPQKRGRPDAWAPPTPSTGQSDAKGGTHPEEQKGPWVWPEPEANHRPPLQRQQSEPEVARARPLFERQVSAPEPGGWRKVARDEWPEGINEAPAVATARRKGGRRCVLITQGERRFRVRVRAAGIRVYAQ